MNKRNKKVNRKSSKRTVTIWAGKVAHKKGTCCQKKVAKEDIIGWNDAQLIVLH